MSRVLRFVLLGALMAVPMMAAEPAAESPLSFSPMATAQTKSPLCPESASFDICGGPQYNSIVFINQKPNLVCVYRCSYSITCQDSVCGLPDQVTNYNFRVRSAPYEYPLNGCPAPDISFCTSMEVGD